MRMILLFALLLGAASPLQAQQRLTGEWMFLVERWTVTETSEGTFTLTVVHNDSEYTWPITLYRASKLKGIMVRAPAPEGRLRRMNTEDSGKLLYIKVFTTTESSLVCVDWLRPVGDDYAQQVRESSRKEWRRFQSRTR